MMPFPILRWFFDPSTGSFRRLPGWLLDLCTPVLHENELLPPSAPCGVLMAPAMPFIPQWTWNPQTRSAARHGALVEPFRKKHHLSNIMPHPFCMLDLLVSQDSQPLPERPNPVGGDQGGLPWQFEVGTHPLFSEARCHQPRGAPSGVRWALGFSSGIKRWHRLWKIEVPKEFKEARVNPKCFSMCRFDYFDSIWCKKTHGPIWPLS